MKNSTLPFFLFLILAAAVLQPGSAARAQDGAIVRLIPVAQNENAFTVDVVAENVTDLYGLEFFLTYDPAVLTVVDNKPEQGGIQIEPGTLLPVETGFVVSNQADQTAGRVSYAMTLLNPAPPVSGSGSLAQVTFQNLQKNVPSTVDIAKVKLVSSELQIIPARTEGMTLDAREISTAASSLPSSDFPWWIAGVAVIIVGLIALTLVLVFDSTRNEPNQTQSDDNIAKRPARGRPSAFK